MIRGEVWIKAETFDGERRAPLTPEDAGALVSDGARVMVEKSETRIFPDSAYAAQGCKLVEPGSWQKAENAVILGIKYLEKAAVTDKAYPITGKTLIHWAHAFDGDPDEQQEVSRLEEAGHHVRSYGRDRHVIEHKHTLFDLEALVKPDGSRAFTGYNAGVAGAAMSLSIWLQKRAGKQPPFNAPKPVDNKEALGHQAAGWLANSGLRAPRVVIVGARGKAGAGAAWLCEQAGIRPHLLGREQVRAGELEAALDHADIVLNCISMGPRNAAPLIDDESLRAHQRPLVIGDIACYPKLGGLRFNRYQGVTNWKNPTVRVRMGDAPVDIIGIDNLPNLIAKEASEGISAVLRKELPRYLKARRQDTVSPLFATAHRAAQAHMDYAMEVKDLAYSISTHCVDHVGNLDTGKARDMLAEWAGHRLFEQRKDFTAGDIALFAGYFIAGVRPVYELRAKVENEHGEHAMNALERFAQDSGLENMVNRMRGFGHAGGIRFGRETSRVSDTRALQR